MPFGIPSQKRGAHLGFETLVEVFVFKEEIFFWLELVELFRLYLLHFVLYFLALATFVLLCWDIHVRGSIFVLYVSCFKLLIDLCL